MALTGRPLPFAPRRPTRERRACPLRVETLEDRTLLSGSSLALPVPISPGGTVEGLIATAGTADFYQVTLAESGRLTVSTQPDAGTSATVRLSLLVPDGQLLIQSEGQSSSNHDGLIIQNVVAGTYVLEVTGLGSGTGTYTLTTDFLPAIPPNQPLEATFLHDAPWALTPTFNATADFNGDGHLDLATANVFTNDVSVLLGLGDGTFQGARRLAAGVHPIGITVGDFNGDGLPDLAAANALSNDVSVLLGNGDGTFQAERRLAGGTGAWALASADLNGDGRLDLVVVNRGVNSISVLLGNGDGTFRPEVRYATGNLPSYLTLGDFNGDGHLDLVVSNFKSNDLSFFLGSGDGTFQDPVRLATGTDSGDITNPGAIVSADLDGDGRLDLAVTNSASNAVSVLLGRGDGTFQGPVQWAAGTNPVGLVTGDFDGDGRLDLATTNQRSDDVSILLGRGDGTFQDQVRYRAGFQPVFLVTGDFNEDGRKDLATANFLSHDLSILLGLGNGTFQPDLTDTRLGRTNPQDMVVDDFNRDGIPDLATVSYTAGDLFVFLGRGDGTFQERIRFSLASTPTGLVSGDFNGDGIPDLIAGDCFASSVSVLLGKGDGTFQEPVGYASSLFSDRVLAADFNGDGHLDLFTGGQLSNQFAILLGHGDGTFQDAFRFTLQESAANFIAADFNGDGLLDLALTNVFSPDHDVSILLGRGDGTFEPALHFAVGSQPAGIASGDFNGDGLLDLVVANSGSNDASVLLGKGDGTFLSEVRYLIGGRPDSVSVSGGGLLNAMGPDSVAVGDLDGDGQLDLAVTSSASNDATILLGRGDGTFQTGVAVAVTDSSTPHRGLAAADLDGDGRLDLVATQLLTSDVSVLLGTGNGSFQAPLRFPVGLGPVAVVTGDFSNDGRLDVASVNPTTNAVAVALGNGDGTLQTPQPFPVGAVPYVMMVEPAEGEIYIQSTSALTAAPIALVAGDFNGDGRLDLATANFASHDVSVLLGLGDGTFRQETRFPAGMNPTAIVTGDFNGDGRLDLAVANARSNDVSILLGNGDGTFACPESFAAGDLPQALVAGDFNGDGIPDLAVADYRSQDVTVLMGRGDGTFRDPVRLALGTAPLSLIAGDLDGDGSLDLATANFRSNDVSILLGRGDGNFQQPVRFDAGTNPLAVITRDFDGDGILDLATVHGITNAVALLLGRGDGTFTSPVQQPVAASPAALVAADFNNDGRTDLAVATQFSVDISVLPGLGNGTFLSPDTISNGIRATPLVADLNGDGTADVVVVNNRGEVLLRRGRPGTPGTFDPPLVLNPDARLAARELAVVRTGHGLVLAALNARDSALSFYFPGPDGTFTGTPGPVVPGTLPVRLISGDLNGDGLDDLVVATTGTNQALVYLQRAAGGFGPLPDYQVGVGVNPSAIDLADVDSDGRPDVVVTNQFSGDVSVLLNDPIVPFASESRFRASTGLYWVEEHSGSPIIRTYQGSAGVVAGQFDSDGTMDLVVTNSGSNSFSLLQGTGLGGFLNPQPTQTYSTGVRPTAVVSGDFNHDGYLDLAILNEGSETLSVFLGDGQGRFTETIVTGPDGQPVPLSAGNAPAGLALADINGDSRLDLLVGNEFGDVLVLLGNSDGTFQPYQRAERNVALAVADVNGDGRDDFIFGNAGLDRVSVQYSQPEQSFLQDRSHGLLAPGAVAVTDLNGDGWPDLAVANSGANNVLVYLGAGGGQFAPARRFFAGTSPAGLTVADLNGDGRPDLVVANQGSNDVTLLLGQGQGTSWDLAPGPRLRTDAGPVSTTVQDVSGDGIPDLLVSNSQSNNVLLLPGVGGGFFNDQNPLVLATGTSPQQVLLGNFDSRPGLDLVAINAGSNDLTFFSDFIAPGTVPVSIFSGGLIPVAALMGDFNSDGLSDLVVAHNGDGAISLLFGQEDGLSLEEFRFLAGLPHPTALVLAGTEGTELELYVAGEGAEEVYRLSFARDLGPIALATSESLSFSGSGREQVADLLPLVDTSLASVAILLTVRLERETLSTPRAQGLAEADPEEGPGTLIALLQNRAGGEAFAPGGTVNGEKEDPPEDDPDAGALLELMTGREEMRDGRRPVTREDILNPQRPEPPAADTPELLQGLDGWLPGSAAVLGLFWQSLADGGLQGREKPAVLEPVVAPVRAGMVVVSDSVVEAMRTGVDAVRELLIPAEDPGAQELPAPEQADEQSRRQPAEKEAGGVIPAALLAAVFGLGLCVPLVPRHQDRSRRANKSPTLGVGFRPE
jgi:FG-GAP-like repeat